MKCFLMYSLVATYRARLKDLFMLIRPAISADLPRIVDIWAPVIRDTTITFSSELRSVQMVADLIEKRRAAGREFFVAERETETASPVIGFASYDQFRSGNGYLHAMEHTIILAPEGRGGGAGRALMAAVNDHASAAGAHTMVAAIDGDNVAAQAFHAAVGFEHVGRLPQSGRKFDRWLDLVLMQKIIG